MGGQGGDGSPRRTSSRGWLAPEKTQRALTSVAVAGAIALFAGGTKPREVARTIEVLAHCDASGERWRRDAGPDDVART
jgi:hypothetical protein